VFAALLLVFALVSASCSSSDREPQADEAAETGPPLEADFGDVDATVDEFVAESDLDGAGLVVVHPDLGVVHEHYAGEFDADRVSLIASASKMLTAGVLMGLHDDGALDVDAPVAEVVDWGAANPDITPAQLLSNSSGLGGLLDDPTFRPYICQYVPGGTLQGCGEQIFTTTEDDEDVVPPDTEFRYGGGQWQVAGAVAEAASGRSWAELVEQTYVEPCGVDSLGYNNHYGQITSDDGPFTYPSQFGGDPSTLAETQNPNMEGGAYITAPDYATLLLMALRGGMCGDTRVLSEESVERMQTDRVGDYGGEVVGGFEGYGLGWFVSEDGSYIEDGGAFGAVPWIDLGRRYGAYLVVEDSSRVGRELAGRVRPLIDQQIDVLVPS
jgi:CubicO group peptidase (beta-lactamase class C family)